MPAGSAAAAERLDYAPPGPSATVALHAYLADQGKTLDRYYVAATDLNKDNLNEYILKPKACGAAACDYTVLAALSGGTLHEIGALRGRSLMLGNAYAHGVRNLMIFTTPGNDYAYTLYKWYPQENRYDKKEP